MEPTESITILQAVGLYINSIKAKTSQQYTQQELSRFVHWCGLERTLADLNPSVIGDYTDQVGYTPQAAERLQVVRDFLSYARKKGLMDKNLAQHVRIRKPKARSNHNNHSQEAREPVELTPEGHAQLVMELEQLKAMRAPLAQEIQRAAADKDVRENAPLEAAREQLGMLESQIRAKEAKLSAAVIIDPSTHQSQHAARLGRYVSVKDLNTGKETTYMLVSPSEANPLDGKISDASPLGKALLGRFPGQEVEVETPRGKMRYRILKVSS